ncbi:DUF2309 domain-containing protein [Neorhodopirellula pilleata]|uniref:Probable inorganic carbon transporter subunit DabA n=1 Tax=Neorhodopirellula pilleata TaxID=2714738 RepID=A0A5C5ZL89_9BACT|nr:DUF2309 domain-containing protein [Neorhodopirellula pilleata]TWT87960.1 hypothetical protein Pla100_58120 [Neorhodopirellula pilleata]
MSSSTSSATPADATKESESSPPADLRIDRIEHAIEHAKHYLPAQGPISIFVHHNTLHAFEDLPFDKAVIEGGRHYHCEPYLSEERYRDELSRGRITLNDLREVLMDDLGDDADTLVSAFGTRYTLRLAMLQMTVHSVPEAELKWLLAETDVLRNFRAEISPQRREKTINQTRSWVMRHVNVNSAEQPNPESTPPLPDTIRRAIEGFDANAIELWSDATWESFVLHALWQICRHGVEVVDLHAARPTASIGIGDQVLRATGENIDSKVNEILIRFCGSFLDQGFADWTLPDREKGFARSFATLFGGAMTIKPNWLKGIRHEMRTILQGNFDPLASIAASLVELEVNDVEQAIESALMGLRGWTGMIWQMESSTPFLPHPIPSGSLNEYLAIRLILQRYAIVDLGRRRFGSSDLSQILSRLRKKPDRHQGASIDERTYRIFQLAQVGGWTPEQLIDMSVEQWQCLINEIESFSSIQRRRILHAAYERNYAVSALDALTIHARQRHDKLTAKKSVPAYVAIFCIDDREESFRRHLEEVDPACQTASAAGFFAVAMYYQGADHAHFRPLCPAIVTPQHYVREEPMFSAADVSEKRAQRRRRIGWFAHQVHSGSRTLIGGWVTGVFGAIATFPMVARIMAPRLTSRIREATSVLVRPPATELHLERTSPTPGSAPESLGYSLDEMATIVVRILEDIGMTQDFPPIIVFFGHGSSSLNNPHESAYNCGACSGGRGGPNARAFAMMANDRRVRRLVADRGIDLRDDVCFVGAYHNTCNDHVEYYDLDLLPRTHRALFRRIEANINETRRRNAHERCRRFESAPLSVTPEEALEHVEERAEDLSQARPEYNHATNALVTVGRREWTRGLYMDRRVFLTQYDPSVDDEECRVLTRILQAAIPVCAGISLEYYFSSVDVEGYGCGSKLPHNIVAMVGVMTGAASDLRPGLSQQMIEIHEPMRILFVIETTPAKLDRIIQSNPGIARLVQGNWVQVAVIDPDTATIQRYVNGRYVPHLIENKSLPTTASSMDWYRGQRSHLPFASISKT